MNDNTCAGFGQPPKPNSRQIAKEAARAKVLEAARASFEFVGFEKTTIRDIAANIGMSTGAIFASYPNKTALYRAVYGFDPISPEMGLVLLEALRDLRTLIAPEFVQSTICAHADLLLSAKVGA